MFLASHQKRPCGFDFNLGSDSFSTVEDGLPLPQTLLLTFIALNAIAVALTEEILSYRSREHSYINFTNSLSV